MKKYNQGFILKKKFLILKIILFIKKSIQMKLKISRHKNLL